MMRRPSVCVMIALLGANTGSGFAQTPEIVRPAHPPEALDTVHVLRNIPEACVRLEGRFALDRLAPYRLSIVPRSPCQPRAQFESTVDTADSAGWVLNDRIVVTRADRASCVATIQIWRHPGSIDAATRDQQQRVRIYLDRPVASNATSPRFRADLDIDPSCAE